MIRRRLAICGLAAMLAAGAAAGAPPSNVRPIAPGADDDFSPVFSPDGKWLVFVSERDGDTELRAMRADRPALEPPRHLAPSAAEDHSPAFSPDGRWLAWISTREDVFGDVWAMRFPYGEPFAISEHGAIDRDPAWRTDGDGVRLEWIAADHAGGETRKLARPGAWRTAVVVDAVDAEEAAIVLLHEDDTNGDGAASAASGDWPSIWRRPANGDPWRQLTPPMRGLNSPSLHGGRLVFSANFRGDLDIAEIREPFEVATLASATNALAAARRLREARPAAAFDIASLARQGYLLEPGSREGVECALLAIDVLREANRPEQALRTVRNVEREPPADATQAARLAIRAAALASAVARRKGGDEPAGADALAAIAGDAGLPADVRAEAAIERARLLAEAGDARGAVGVLEDAADPAASGAMRARLGLERARMAARFAPEAAGESYRALIAGGGLDGETAQTAAREWIATFAGLAPDDRRIALRRAAAQLPESKAVQAATILAEGNDLVRAGRSDEAERTLRAAMEFESGAPRLAAEAAFAAAELQAAEGRYADAVSTYESVQAALRDRIFAEAPRFVEEARAGLEREFLARGNEELRLGDPQLAEATFRKLLEREPRLVEAWRGLLEARHRSGRLDAREIAQYRDDARGRRDDALAWYLHGLALTYRSPVPREAERSLARAIALDASVPYFHQTLGFVQEARARATGNRQDTANAWESYQRALALVDPASRPTDWARLLVNSANAAMGLGLHARAADLYGQRLEQGIPFDDPRTEFLAARQHGIALFRSFRAAAAAEKFAFARERLATLEKVGLVGKEPARELDVELQDRRALALLDAGRFAESAEEFRSVAERAGDRSLDRARALRNRGIALFRLASSTGGGESERARREAKRSLEEALAILRDRGSLSIPIARQAGGMFGGLEFGITSSDLGGASLNLSPEDEERLVVAAIGRLQVLGGETDGAIASLERQLAQPPPYSEGTKAYHVTARLVALDRLAAQRIAAGDGRGAAKELATILREARFTVKDEEATNAGALVNALVRLTELAISSDEPPFGAADLAIAWLGPQPDGADALRALDACIENAGMLRDADGNAIVASTDRTAWLALCRALLAERMALRGGAGIEGVRAAADEARADVLARRAIAAARGDESTEEARRIGALAWGVLLRTGARRMDGEVVARREEALRYLGDIARPELKWWMHAQESLAAETALARGAAFEALNALEALPPGLWTDRAPIPHALLDHCRRLALDAAIDDGDWNRAFALDERWRVARLRLAAGRMTPPSPEHGEERAWLAQALALRGSMGEALAALRLLPVGAASDADRARFARAASLWRDQLVAGRERGFATARLLDPVAVEVENPATALGDLAALPSPPAVVLATHRGAVAWTTDGIAILDGDEAWANLGARATVWFVAGDAPIPTEAPDATIRLLSLDATAAAMADPRLDAGGPTMLWPIPGKGDERPDRAAERIGLMRELDPRGEDPFAWIVGGRGTTLGELLELAPRLESLDARLVRTDRDAEQLLAAAAASRGIVSTNVDGAAWTGLLFPPSLMPQVAGDELDAAVGEVRAALEAGSPAEALAPARQVLYLRRALEASHAEIAEAGLLLAQVLGDLGRFEEAVEHSRLAATLLREGDSPLEYAGALRIHGSYCNSARRFGDASDAFAEARAIFEGAGMAGEARDMTRRAGVAFENAGRIGDAMAAYGEVLASATDPREAAEQWRRIGRLRLQRLADFPGAEDAFRAAVAKAVEADAADLEILATLDVARCRERLGDYDAAARTAVEMRERARAIGDRAVECDALLLAAFVDWARADYAAAFRAQSEALAIAEEIGDVPYAVVARNTGGLIRWSLNDTGRALAEYGAALDLARAGIFDGETASTLNNRSLVLRSIAEYDKALDDLKEALSIDRTRQDRWGEAYALRNMGIVHLMRGNAAEAVEPLSRAIDIAGEIGDRPNRAKAVAALGDAMRESGDDSRARELYLDALSESRAIPLPEIEWRTLHGLAMLEKGSGRLAEAAARLDEALAVVERLRAAIRVEEFQEGFLLDKQHVYDAAVELALDRGDAAGAFALSERSRGRHFIDLLGNRRMDLRDAADDEALARERTLRTEIESVERRLVSLEGPDRAAAESRLREARDRYSDFLTVLRASNPQLSAFVEVAPVDLAELQSLLDADTRLLEYHVLEDEVVAWIVSRDGIRATRTAVARGELAARVQAWRGRIQEFDRVAEETAILSSLLLAPNVPYLEGASRIGVVPHRELHLLPVAALRLDEGHAIDRFAIFHAPSAGVLRYTFARRGAARGTGVLAIGNPDLGDAALSLPFAEKEAERLALTFPGATLATGAAATETWIGENIGRYAIVHVASHGEYDPAQPMMSAIRLASDGVNDGVLTADEVFGLAIDADLVALSACQTGLGRAGAGDDVVGLNRSFVYAGTRQILSTLWRVDDVSTAVLVKHFYRNVREGSTDRAEALRRAQIEVRKRYPHPAHWSGMTLSGDWE